MHQSTKKLWRNNTNKPHSKDYICLKIVCIWVGIFLLLLNFLRELILPRSCFLDISGQRLKSHQTQNLSIGCEMNSTYLLVLPYYTKFHFSPIVVWVWYRRIFRIFFIIILFFCDAIRFDFNEPLCTKLSSEI